MAANKMSFHPPMGENTGPGYRSRLTIHPGRPGGDVNFAPQCIDLV
jgi:hypothetical protein